MLKERVKLLFSFLWTAVFKENYSFNDLECDILKIAYKYQLRCWGVTQCEMEVAATMCRLTYGNCLFTIPGWCL